MEVMKIDCDQLQSVPVESYVHELALLAPVYVEGGGDMTRVVTMDGDMWNDPRPVPVVLKGIARHFGVDLTAVRERYGDILGRRLYVPLPFAPRLTLVPVKMRQPRIAKDGTTGYVAAQVIERVMPGARTTTSALLLGGGQKVKCLQSGEFVRQQLRNARIVQTFYKETMSLGLTVPL
ncbi:hypothetical protein CIG75_02075 [Tumebacillus algifaecis]|uniref:Uncharacterized protein n=1 Tax=Tumebacillus algifaecis TaxID=1214604 RepID=A0A223CXG0_9BACL|nr:hypothetical protein [Tumebacillus algifaecis]ASS73877.1 hypothetical protein CIG75_02075 [Tumebacillus algifaecis]